MFVESYEAEKGALSPIGPGTIRFEFLSLLDRDNLDQSTDGYSAVFMRKPHFIDHVD